MSLLANRINKCERELDPYVIKGGGVKQTQIMELVECQNVINGLIGLDRETDQHDKI